MPRRPTVDCVKASPYRSGRPLLAATVFAATPWITLGFGSALAFGFAALFLRGISRRVTAVFLLSAAVYAAALGLFLATVDDTPDDSLSATATTALMVMFIAAGVEAVSVSPLVARAVGGRRQAHTINKITEEERKDLAHDPAIRAAIEQRERRKLAREILANDRALAKTLCIGRPDLHRDFADGGLIDVNHVPDRVLCSLPGVDADMADRIVSARERLDGLRSPADLVVEADVPSDVVDALTDVLVFPVEKS